MAALTPVKVDAPRMASASTLSPKTILAATIPAISTLIGVVVLGVITGEFDELELAAGITGVSTSALAGLAAYLGAPGTVAIPAEVSFEGRPAEVRSVPGP